MPKIIPPEIVEQCRDLYVNHNLSYEAVVEKVGDISKPTVAKMAQRWKWQKQREHLLDLEGNVQKLINEVTKQALKSKTPQDIYALSNLLKAAQALRPREQQVDRLALSLEFLSDLMDYLNGRGEEAAAGLIQHMDGFGTYLKGKYAEA